MPVEELPDGTIRTICGTRRTTYCTHLWQATLARDYHKCRLCGAVAKIEAAPEPPRVAVAVLSNDGWEMNTPVMTLSLPALINVPMHPDVLFQRMPDGVVHIFKRSIGIMCDEAFMAEDGEDVTIIVRADLCPVCARRAMASGWRPESNE